MRGVQTGLFSANDRIWNSPLRCVVNYFHRCECYVSVAWKVKKLVCSELLLSKTGPAALPKAGVVCVVEPELVLFPLAGLRKR